MKCTFLLLSCSILVWTGCEKSDPSPKADASSVNQASAVDSSSIDETSPESVLRTFLLGIAERDAETLMRVGNGEGPLELLLAGAPLSEAQLSETKQQIKEMEITQLKPGEAIPYPSGGEIKFDEGDINATRLKLMTPTSPLPFDLQQFDGVWYVNVDPIIAVKKAAAKLRQENGE